MNNEIVHRAVYLLILGTQKLAAVKFFNLTAVLIYGTFV